MAFVPVRASYTNVRVVSDVNRYDPSTCMATTLGHGGVNGEVTANAVGGCIVGKIVCGASTALCGVAVAVPIGDVETSAIAAVWTAVWMMPGPSRRVAVWAVGVVPARFAVSVKVARPHEATGGKIEAVEHAASSGRRRPRCAVERVIGQHADGGAAEPQEEAVFGRAPSTTAVGEFVEADRSVDAEEGDVGVVGGEHVRSRIERLCN